ncbi:MAG: inorganic pyrophosphatase [Pirellulaceae bacterium]|nr:inorganic pyrophosphatase [Pirellulaceae bacterium]
MSFSQPFFRWRPHPWHGLGPGPEAPKIVEAYIEITPFDFVKYEIDKTTGYLRVDRPQRYSSQPPTLYGFIPQTYCGRRVSELSPKSNRGDGDPMDICIISERPITRAEVVVRANVVGGLQLLDNGEADDKIIAVLANDNILAKVNELKQIPEAMVARIKHYFSTYKSMVGEEPEVTIESVYGREQACKVIKASMEDYDEEFGRG